MTAAFPPAQALDFRRSALRTTCTVIQGPPGTGKTHVAKLQGSAGLLELQAMQAESSEFGSGVCPNHEDVVQDPRPFTSAGHF